MSGTWAGESGARTPAKRSLVTWMSLALAVVGVLLLIQAFSARGRAGRPAVFADLTLAQARADAAAGRRVLLVDYWAAWCGPCRMMDERTWNDPGVAAWVAQHAVAVQIDVDRNGDLARAASVSAIPLVVVEIDGNVVERIVGFVEPGSMLARLRQATGR